MNTVTCPQCHSENTYPEMNFQVCAECFYEWNPQTQPQESPESTSKGSVLDCNGNPLSPGDSVTVIKDLKVKGSASGLKAGTKIKNIRLVDPVDGHNVACKVDGIGSMFLKSELLKKS